MCKSKGHRPAAPAHWAISGPAATNGGCPMGTILETLGFTQEERRAGGLVLGRRGHVAAVLLDRPKVGNAINNAMIAEFGTLWHEFEADPDVRAIVLGSTGSRFFCTGRDISEVNESGQRQGDVNWRHSFTLTSRHAITWTPVICAVEGKALGAGLHFVVDADIVVAGRAASFLDTHVNVGFVGAFENLGLALKAGLGSALYLTLLGKEVALDADRAMQLGLVQEVVDEGSALPRAIDLADIVANSSPTAVSRSLEAIWGLATFGGYEQALQYGWSLVQRQRLHPDSVEGPRAWAERREPRWRE
jgi:E-phenylitaconyl-CoA hydratase